MTSPIGLITLAAGVGVASGLMQGRSLEIDGDDVLYGENGFDRIAGGSGDDTMRGGKFADELLGGPGREPECSACRNWSISQPRAHAGR